MSTHFRVTYATLSADNEELHAAYEAGLRLACQLARRGHPWVRERRAARPAGELFTVTSPGDLSLTLCRVHSATAGDVEDAVRAAVGRGGPVGANALAGAGRGAPGGGRPDQRAVQRARRADEPGGRQEPA